MGCGAKSGWMGGGAELALACAALFFRFLPGNAAGAEAGATGCANAEAGSVGGADAEAGSAPTSSVRFLRLGALLGAGCGASGTGA